MHDVMSSLDDMSMARDDAPEEEELARSSLNPWSPDAFDEINRSAKRPEPRPLTSLGLGAGGSNYSEQPNYSSRHNSPDRYVDGPPPQLRTYVQRMESRLRQMQEAKQGPNKDDMGSDPPEPPPKNSPWSSRPVSAMAARAKSIRNRKSAYELRDRPNLDRTYTTKTSSTNASSGVQSVATNQSAISSKTSQSVMSGHSAGAFSATSAGSLARRNKFGSIRERVTGRPMTSTGTRGETLSQQLRPQTPLTGISYHSSHDSRQGTQSAVGWEIQSRPDSSAGLGGFTTPKAKKTGFFKKLIDSAKTTAASTRGNIGAPGMTSSPSPTKLGFNNGITAIAGGTAVMPHKQQKIDAFGRDAGREMGLTTDWVSMRRDVNRSNTPGPSERQERVNRCQILDQPVICPIEELFEEVDGDENVDGLPVPDPFQLSNPSFSLVDKAARFITSLPATITPSALATGYVCRPHRSDIQRLRAIFTWCAERVAWEEDFDGELDSRRVIQSRRGGSQEVAYLVMEMCHAIGLHSEVIRGFLKTPGEELDLNALDRANHHWNAILVDNEWRMMDCSLASPTNPRRSKYSSISTSIAEPFYFLTKPLEFCYTHVPIQPEHQHFVPPISPDVLLSLPCALPPYFQQRISVHNYDTSLIRLESLELCHISINVPADVEIVAEVEAKSYLTDQDGDVYENIDGLTKKRALTQASWYTPATNMHLLQKRYIVKAFLPGDERQGVLKVYAGKKGLMHSAKEIVHPLAFALPLYHQGDNPKFDFVKRYPTVHAMRSDLYVMQPQCYLLCAGETYVFAVRQHAASVMSTPISEQGGFDFRPVSPNPFARPGSAMSMTSSAAGSNPSESSGSAPGGMRVKEKPAKLAVQSPGGKIIRLARKADNSGVVKGNVAADGTVEGSVWESVVRVQEKGIWRGLVLADRSARWCVWGEWECV
jgi:Transglutaminase-like superfamily